MNREIKFRAWDEANGMINWEIADKKDGRFLMQFTGLKDKNGKKIYEGDVIQLYDQAQGHKNGRDVVELESFLIMKYQRSLESRSIEVIGNIYENPELKTNL